MGGCEWERGAGQSLGSMEGLLVFNFESKRVRLDGQGSKGRRIKSQGIWLDGWETKAKGQRQIRIGLRTRW